jgi:hypothetical protein
MQASRIIVTVSCALTLGAAVSSGCAGSKRDTRDPAACMRSCEQERCEYVPDGLGDNSEYLDCLEACEQHCAR